MLILHSFCSGMYVSTIRLSYCRYPDLLPLTIGDADLDISGWEERTSLYARSSAFFSEPAHFAQYLLPLLVIELFYVSDKSLDIVVCFILLL